MPFHFAIWQDHDNIIVATTLIPYIFFLDLWWTCWAQKWCVSLRPLIHPEKVQTKRFPKKFPEHPAIIIFFILFFAPLTFYMGWKDVLHVKKERSILNGFRLLLSLFPCNLHNLFPFRSGKKWKKNCTHFGSQSVTLNMPAGSLVFYNVNKKSEDIKSHINGAILLHTRSSHHLMQLTFIKVHPYASSVKYVCKKIDREILNFFPSHFPCIAANAVHHHLLQGFFYYTSKHTRYNFSELWSRYLIGFSLKNRTLMVRANLWRYFACPLFRAVWRNGWKIKYLRPFSLILSPSKKKKSDDLRKYFSSGGWIRYIEQIRENSHFSVFQGEDRFLPSSNVIMVVIYDFRIITINGHKTRM